jgi:hypothetical protein
VKERSTLMGGGGTKVSGFNARHTLRLRRVACHANCVGLAGEHEHHPLDQLDVGRRRALGPLLGVEAHLGAVGQ